MPTVANELRIWKSLVAVVIGTSVGLAYAAEFFPAALMTAVFAASIVVAFVFGRSRKPA